MSGQDLRLNHTIYINNLNEKIKKDGMVNAHMSLLVAQALGVVMFNLRSVVGGPSDLLICY